MTGVNKESNDTEAYLSIMRDKPVYRKMVREGVFTETQLDECLRILYENDLREENK